VWILNHGRRHDERCAAGASRDLSDVTALPDRRSRPRRDQGITNSPLGHQRPFHGLNPQESAGTAGIGLLADAAKSLRIIAAANTYKYP
jgi:hypothetical protein